MTSMANRYVAIGRESTYGTAVTVDAYGEIDDESFTESFDLLGRDDMNRFGTQKMVRSKNFASGTVNAVFQPDFFIMRLLHGAYGKHTPGGTPGVNDKLEEGTGSTFGSFTVKIGRDDKEYVYPGQVVESISISANVGEYVMFSASLTGKNTTTSLATLATPTYDFTWDAAHFVGAYVNFEDTASNSAFSKLVQSIDFEIKMNRDMDNSYNLGDSSCTREPPIQRREITGNITFHKAVQSADVAVDEPTFVELLQGHLNDGTTANPAISCMFEVDSNNFVRFDFFKVHYGVPVTNVSGRDTQTMTVPFTVLFDETNGEMSEVLFSSESTKLKGGSAVDMDA